MSDQALVIEGLCATVAGKDILKGVDLTVRPREVHAVMGRNGSGKSTLAAVLAGRSGYTVTGGSVTLDGVDLLALSVSERAQAGLFLAMQYPTEVPGVALSDVMVEALAARPDESDTDTAALLSTEAERVGFPDRLLARDLNVDLSGGEKKRAETVQLGVLRPRYAVLDEIDSGLDVDALRAVSRRIEDATTEWSMGVIAITHYTRLLKELRADVVHVFADGRIVRTGGPELAAEIEAAGYSDTPGR